MSKSIDIIIVEDNERYREGMKLILDSTFGFACVGAFGDCESALLEVEEINPNIVLMDIELPGMNGIEGTAEIRRSLPDVDVIMLTDHGKEEYVFRALQNGACGYLIKTTQPMNLLDNIRAVYEGGSAMSPKIARMVTGFFNNISDSPTPLTDRETEILRLAGGHANNKEIADILFISVDTVRTHFKNIYEKLEVHSKLEAYSKASKKKWI